MRVPQATVIHVEHLPPASRRRLAHITARRGPLAPTVAAPADRAGVVGLAIAGGGAVMASADALGGAALPAPVRAVVLTALALATAAALAWAVACRWRAAAMPCPPGCYVIGAYVVDARRPLLRVSPIARTRPEVRRRLGRPRLVFAGEAVRCSLPLPEAHVERALAWMHGDVVAYASALTAGDRATAGQLDPLAEARDATGEVIGVPGPPRRRLPPVPAVAAIVAALALATAVPVACWWLARPVAAAR